MLNRVDKGVEQCLADESENIKKSQLTSVKKSSEKTDIRKENSSYRFCGLRQPAMAAFLVFGFKRIFWIQAQA